MIVYAIVALVCFILGVACGVHLEKTDQQVIRDLEKEEKDKINLN